MKVIVLALAVATLAGAPGCALKRSHPARIYILDARTPKVEVPSSAAAPAGVIGVSGVSIPGWIDRPQIARRTAAGEVAVDEFSRWGEPLARGIQRVLTENLAALLADRRVVAAPFPRIPAVGRRVDLTITEAARQADGTVLVEARWSVVAGDGNILQHRTSTHRIEALPAGPGGTVSGVSDALALLARDIASALMALPPAAAAPVP